MIGIEIYSSFESNDVDRTGIIPTPNRSKEEFLGGHCMLIVGFDNATQYFKVLNSWGTDWGSAGYCFMAYDYILNPLLTPDLFTVSFTI
jgi:C1A family cysteine protease